MRWGLFLPQPAWTLGEAGTVIAGQPAPSSLPPAPQASCLHVLPSPPGWLRVWSRWKSVCPSLLCLLVLPSLHSVLSFFLVYQALGKAGASQTPSRAPWEAASREHSRRLRLWGKQLSHHPPPPDPGSTRQAWQIAPLPAWGKPLGVLGFQSLLFRLEDSGMHRIY